MSDNAPMTPAQFVEMTNLRMTYEQVKERPEGDTIMDDEWNKTAYHFLVTLKTARRSMSFYYSKGEAHATYQPKGWPQPHPPITWCGVKIKKGDHKPMGFRKPSQWELGEIGPHWVPIPPDMFEVLESVAMDCLSVQNNPLWEEYASEFGYDVDSRKAHKSFKAGKRQADKVRSMLGDVWYNALIYRVNFDTTTDNGEG